MLDTVVMSADDVCCSVVFGTLVGVFVCSYNGMYGSSLVVLGISSSSLLWELALVDNKSVFLIS